MSSKKQLGINMINMYEGMINEDFDPLISRLTARGQGVKDKVERQVKIDLGIYNLYEEKAAIELRLKEIKDQLETYEKGSYQQRTGVWRSLLQEEVEKRMDLLNEPLREVKAAKADIIRQIRLAGVGAEVKSTFEGLPKLLEDLTKKFGTLPPLTEWDVKQLSVPIDADVE